jgi:hypothetical protein
MKQLKDFAYASSGNPEECLALYVELLEAHIKHQDDLLATFQQELDQILIELSKEQA